MKHSSGPSDDQRNPITPEGYRLLVAELERYKRVLRPQVIKDLEAARAHGDITDNADFRSAKERQAQIEGRVAELEHLVAAAEIVDVKKLEATDRVVFGTTVVIENPKTGEERTWQIVGETEANVAEGRISWKSPLARAVIGRREGEEAKVPAPGGVQVWEILEVRYV